MNRHTSRWHSDKRVHISTLLVQNLSGCLFHLVYSERKMKHTRYGTAFEELSDEERKSALSIREAAKHWHSDWKEDIAA